MSTELHPHDPLIEWKGVRFLDPTGKVFVYNGRYYRAIYPHAETFVRSLFSDGIVEKLCKNNWLVHSKISKDLSMSNFAFVIEHEAESPSPRFKEWPLEMWKDAAILWLDINLFLLDFDLGLIDGHQANLIQSKQGFPLFCDLGSIQPIKDEHVGIKEFLNCFFHPIFFAEKMVKTGCAGLARNIGPISSQASELLRLPGIKLKSQSSHRI